MSMPATARALCCVLQFGQQKAVGGGGSAQQHTLIRQESSASRHRAPSATSLSRLHLIAVPEAALPVFLFVFGFPEEHECVV